jgi:hypothetical protein
MMSTALYGDLQDRCEGFLSTKGDYTVTLFCSNAPICSELRDDECAPGSYWDRSDRVKPHYRLLSADGKLGFNTTKGRTREAMY